jgi:hypothetical protein
VLCLRIDAWWVEFVGDKAVALHQGEDSSNSQAAAPGRADARGMQSRTLIILRFVVLKLDYEMLGMM